MTLYELKRYKEIVIFNKYVQSVQQDSSGIINDKLKEEANRYLDCQTNMQFDIFKSKDEKGNPINNNKVLTLSLFK